MSATCRLTIRTATTEWRGKRYWTASRAQPRTSIRCRRTFPHRRTPPRAYERTLRNYFGTGPPRLDLILLGLGADGHTASLFPGSPALGERTRWVVAVNTPADPPLRLTLTLPALTRGANTFVLVTGSTKARALHDVLTGVPEPETYPAAGVRLTEGRVIWWVDREAAERCPHTSIAPHLGVREATQS
jgi:6-phosphogluconolactonase/glucosamine-6-phosphate isomerase/deaminase